MAALWTSPIAWNRIPVIGNVELEILSERVFDHPVHPTPRRPLGAYPEQLIVKWRTMGGKKNGSPKWGLRFLDKEGHVVRREGEAGEGEFTGLFVFEFDGQGRIISHTIERVEEGGDWLKGVGAKVVGITEWILSGIRGGRKADEGPCPAFSAVGPGPEVVGNRG